MNKKTILAWVSLAWIGVTPAQAATWQIGLLTENSESPYIGETRKSNPLLMINYYGERLSFDTGKLGYRLSDGKYGETSLIAQTRRQKFYSASMDPGDAVEIEGMEDRDSAIEIGLAWQKQHTWGKLQLEALMDASSTHQGYEVSAGVSYPKQFGRWMSEPGLELQLQSDQLVDYYHGVRTSESRDGLPSYRGRQALNYVARWMAGYAVNQQVLLAASFELLLLDNSISDSPIVENDEVSKVAMGLLYTF